MKANKRSAACGQARTFPDTPVVSDSDPNAEGMIDKFVLGHTCACAEPACSAAYPHSPEAMPLTVVWAVTGAPRLKAFKQPLSPVQAIRMPFDAAAVADLRRQVSGPGVYAIVSHPTERDGRPLVYVGSSGNVGDRIRKQLTSGRHPAAHTVYVLHSTADDLNTAHCRWLEASLQKSVGAHPAVNLDGKSENTFSLAEYDSTLMAKLLPQAYQLLAAAGFPAGSEHAVVLTGVGPNQSDSNRVGHAGSGRLGHDAPAGTADRSSAAASAEQTIGSDPQYGDVWTFEDPSGVLAGLRVCGSEAADGSFVIHAGSHVRMEGEHRLPAEIERHRRRLIDRGLLVPSSYPDGRCVLSAPYRVASRRVAIFVMLKARRSFNDSCWQRSPSASGRTSTPFDRAA